MSSEGSRTCPECRGAMAPVVVMDKVNPLVAGLRLEYRLPDDKPSFWTGRYPSAGPVEAHMCDGCGRIQLYGAARGAGGPSDGRGGPA